MHREALGEQLSCLLGTLQQLGERMRCCRGQTFHALLKLAAGHFVCRMPSSQAPCCLLPLSPASR